jgi:hypothetical protein
MPPQPLSVVNPEATVMFGNTMLPETPEIAAQVMRVISVWAYTESTFATLLTSLIKSDMEIGIAMYQRLVFSAPVI